jgi:pantetheine-phosphate adenylyltransferase
LPAGQNGGEDMAEPRVALYPGTFDPITNGHMDVIRRAARLVDRLVIAVSINPGKGPLFTLEERVAMLEAEIEGLNNGRNIEVRSFDTLLMHFAKAVGAGMVIRGLRAVSDFEYEFQMAAMNARLEPAIETVFLMASERHQFISSRLVKEIGRLGGDVTPFLTPRVAERLVARVAEENGRKG